MDSKMVQPSSDIHEHAEGDDLHPEKQSVLNKVKAKAKKIRDTIKKHSYGQNHDNDRDDHHDVHTPDDHDLKEEDHKYEELVGDPEDHDAPIYDSAATKTGALGGISEPTVETGGSATAMPHGHGQPLASRDVSGVKSSDPTRISVPGLEENIAQPKSNFGKPSPTREEEPHASLNTPVSSFSHGVYEKKDSTDLVEDPPAPKEFNRQDPSNYQTEVSDPTGAGTEEVGATPILRSFDEMKIDDESEPKPQPKLITQAPTGSHDQFSPEPFPPKPSDTPQNPNAMEENLDTGYPNDRATTESATAMPHGHGQPLASRGVSGVKSSDPTRISVPGLEENIAQPKSNLGKPSLTREEEPHAPLDTPVSSFSHGVYEKKDSTDPSGESRVNLQRPKGLEEDPPAPKEFNRQDPSNYQTKVGDSTGEGTEEVGARPILRSFDEMKINDESEPKPQPKLITEEPTGSHDQFSPEPFPPKPSDTPQNPNAMEENLDTRDRNDKATAEINPTNAASYTEKLSSATSVITDKTISAKNVVASKLGYGEKDDTTDHRVHDNEAHGSGDGSTANPSSTVEYEKKIAATETDKPTPVYEKVAGAGSTVISKMFGSGTTGAGNEAEKTEIKGQDRGVRPGDEDGAHSEGISDALHKRKQEPEKAESGPPVGKVTQSEEVTRRLGTGDEKSDRQERDEPATGYVNHPEIGGGGDEKGVVNKLKDAVGSWFGLGGGDQSSQTSHAGDEQGHPASPVGGDSISKDESRVQESVK